MTAILGISAFYHDSAAALIIDAKIISAAQEETFSRKKNDAGYPVNAINFVLKFSYILQQIANCNTKISPFNINIWHKIYIK